MDKGMKGKVAFITGAARGQGRAEALRLARAGVDIIGIDIDQDIDTVAYPLSRDSDLSRTAAEVESAGVRMLTAVVDVRDYDGLKAFLDGAVAELGRLDFVVANAGIVSYWPADELPEQAWQDMIDIDLTGVWHTAKAAIPHLRTGQRGGSMVIISSAAGLRGLPNAIHYAAAKHGLVGVMRTLAIELAPSRIRVNSIHATQVNTDMIHNERTYELFMPDPEKRSLELFEQLSTGFNLLPVPWVEPEDIANVVAFLLSDDARYITGVTLPVDAGALTR